MIRRQRRMGFACAAQTGFCRGQFSFGCLQLRGTGGGGFGCLIGGAFRITHGFAGFHKRRSGSIAPCRERGFAFNQPRILFCDARACGLYLHSR